FEVSEARRRAVVGTGNCFRSVCREVDGAMAKIDERGEVFVGESGARLGTVVVAGIGVGDRVTLSEAVVGKIELTVLAAVSNIEDPAVPVFRKRQLHVEANARVDHALGIAMRRRRAGSRLQDGSRDGEIGQIEESLAV